MEANKVVLNGEVLIDLTGDDTIESDVTLGKRFHKRDGSVGIGTNTGENLPEYDGKVIVTGTPTEEGGGLDINGVIREYEVNAGASVSAGDFVEFVNKFGSGEFNSAQTEYISACKLDNTRVLVVYRDDGNSSYGTAIILTISGTAITVGTATVFNSATTSYISAVALTSDKVLVAYPDVGNSGYGTAIILTIDGTTITVGTATVFNSAASHYISAVALTDSKVFVAYNAGSKGTAIVLTIDDVTITAGTEKAFTGFSVSYISAVALTDSKVFVAYGTGSAGSAAVFTISGTAITKGGSSTFNLASISYVSAVALTESKVLVAYQDKGNSSYGTAIILTISDTSTTKGTETVFSSATTSYISAVALTSDKVLVAYPDVGNSGYGTAIILTIDGTTITVGTAKIFDYNALSYNSLVAFSETSALVMYSTSTGGLGLYSGLSIDGTTITADGSATVTKVQKATSNLHNVGVAKTSGAEGETVEVYQAV